MGFNSGFKGLMTGRNPMKIMYNRVEVTGECTEDATSNDCCCIEVDATDGSFHWKGQEEVW